MSHIVLGGQGRIGYSSGAGTDEDGKAFRRHCRRVNKNMLSYIVATVVVDTSQLLEERPSGLTVCR